ncbi:MAG: oxygen-insensitive NAD(P)H nitroreductase [Sphaerochaetaceae bacterium]
MELMKTIKWRYSTKKFDPTKKVSSEDLKKIEALLCMSPSSTNVQPWHFVIANTEEGKKKISKSTQGFYIFNEAKILDSSLTIVFCSKTNIDEKFLLQLLDSEEEAGRFSNSEQKTNQNKGRAMFIDMHRNLGKDLNHWMQKQVYLNLGSFLLGVAQLGLDAVPMEGFDPITLDEELKLKEKGYTPIALVSIGYRHKDDINASLPKARLNPKETITRI